MMEFQLSYLKYKRWCCSSAILNISANLENSAVATGLVRKGQFSFQSWRRAMPKNAQTTVQLQSFQMIARVCSKSFKLGFSSTWTENFQMCKLGFKEPEEPDIKMPTFAAPWRKEGSSRKPSTSVSLTMLKPLRVWITTHRGESLKDGSTRPPDLLPEKPVCRSGSNS